MTDRLYLDYNASAPMPQAVIDATAVAATHFGNAGAQHAHGRDMRAMIERARESVGLHMGVCAQDVIFTGCGTESDNTAIHSAVQAGSKRLLISAMDHPATVLAAEHCGAAVEIIPASHDGITDMAWLKDRLANWEETDGRPFVSMVASNSETGVIQPVEEAIEITHEAGGLILIDAVQAMGKIAMIGQPDYLAVSAHKIGGPQGVGALYVAPDAPFASLLWGGGQERRRRAGTMNAMGIGGFGAAAKALDGRSYSSAPRDHMEKGLKALEPSLTIFGEGAERLPNTSFFAVPDAASMTLMMQLDLAGISVSTGTACSSGKVGASRAVTAMGLGDKAPQGAIRVSFGPEHNIEDAERFLTAWAKIRQKESVAA